MNVIDTNRKKNDRKQVAQEILWLVVNTEVSFLDIFVQVVVQSKLLQQI